MPVRIVPLQREGARAPRESVGLAAQEHRNFQFVLLRTAGAGERAAMRVEVALPRLVERVLLSLLARRRLRHARLWRSLSLLLRPRDRPLQRRSPRRLAALSRRVFLAPAEADAGKPTEQAHRATNFMLRTRLAPRFHLPLYDRREVLDARDACRSSGAGGMNGSSAGTSSASGIASWSASISAEP